jgi:hypothetical protein
MKTIQVHVFGGYMLMEILFPAGAGPLSIPL